MIRPVGISAGGISLLLAWIGGASIAQLTGASPVVIVLAAGVVLFVAAAIDGLVSALRTNVDELTLPALSVQHEAMPLVGRMRAPRPVWVELRSHGVRVGSAWSTPTGFTTDVEFAVRGEVEAVDVHVRTAGLLGLVWWGRRTTLPIDRHVVAPAARHEPVAVEHAGISSDGDLTGASGAISGEVDGIRPWRHGDSEKFVHWSSSLRAGELVVHDRRQNADQRWIVRARSGTADPDAEAGAARWAIEQGLRSGVAVMAAVDDGDPVSIDHVDEAMEWSALADLGPSTAPHRSWRDRLARVEPDVSATVLARWSAAVATLASLLMLSGALGYSPLVALAITAGVAAGAAVSARTVATGAPAPLWVRVFVSVGAIAAFGMVLAASGRLDGLLDVLRGPLPQVLVILILLHGFECRDRRTIRVGLAISAVVVMYSSGLRVDDAIGWWLCGWALAFGVAMAQMAGPTRPSRSAPRLDAARALVPLRRWGVRVGGVTFAAVATVLVLAVVPVPDGPARLTLPTLIENADGVPSAGAVAGPDGEVREAGDDIGDGDRAPAGQAGGYVGFAQSMDTSVRGDLGDQVVMRVRAPEPDFWRGQTFSQFDGRRWYADDERGTPRIGPDIAVPPALGDIPIADGVEVDRFVQTYFLETDMPNLVFHAGRPVQVVIEANVWARPDGALRADTVLPEGSIYTVVSERPRVDAATLTAQGHVGGRLTALGRQVLGQYLEVPATTTPETIALADELAVGLGSTYEIVRAYEAWMNANVEYDLDAPLPDPGEDAVHDFLFDSQLGFCEQIASALTVMLRTQGVPARLTAGYVSGARDSVAGVYEVRASDAHAWVEVWFPETGWQAFDPTAAVPLSADAEIESIGSDLLAGAAGYVGDHPVRLLLLVVTTLASVGLWRTGTLLVARRRRGRWGTLQDRFASLAGERGVDATAANPARAAAWTTDDDHAVARLVAERLDRVAFDPEFTDDDAVYADTRRLVATLPSK
ncbi:MAG: DUF58 domain-containing protein [Ilumatobacter sp.]|nr:DUF58 domain-containing protein [Ilumatobacter sp.]